MKLRLKGFSDADIIEGGQDAERRARDELRREQRLRVATQSGWPELAREDLVAAHLGLVEHRPSGAFYRISTAEQYGEKFDTAAAYFIDANGDAVFLERPSSGPKTRAELDERRNQKATR